MIKDENMWEFTNWHSSRVFPYAGGCITLLVYFHIYACRWMQVDASVLLDCVNSDRFTIHPDPSDIFPTDVVIGETYFQFVAQNADGVEVERCSFTITVQDLEAPNLVCPCDQAYAADYVTDMAYVDPGLIEATDNSKESVTIYPDPSTFPNDITIGVHVFEFMAMDSFQNVASCSFTITVVSYLDSNFKKYEDAALLGYNTRKLLPVPTDVCAEQCVHTTEFYCLSFDYYKYNNRECDLSDHNISMVTGGLTTDYHRYDYYERDLEPPTLTCPLDTYGTTNIGLSTKKFDYSQSISAVDNIGLVNISPCPYHVFPSNFGIGTVLFGFKATDLSGNTAECKFTITVIDNQNPVVLCPNDTYENTEADLAIAFVDYHDLISVSDNSGEDLHIYPDPYEIYPADVGIGQHIFTFTAIDSSNNTGNCTFMVTVEDNQNPVVSCPNDMNENTEENLATAFVDYRELISVSDNSGEDLHIYPDPHKTYPADVGIGKHSFVFTATDSSDNTGNCTFTVMVKDNQNPVVSCPNNMNENTEANLATTFVDYRELISVSDNSGEDLHIYPDPYEIYPADVGIGQHSFVFTATDSSANTGNCTFTVMVKDNQNPVVVCPNDTYENTEAHLAIACVDYRELISVSDNSGEDLHIYPDPYEVYPADVGIGKHSFTFSATDSSENTGNCTFTLMVEDNQNPVVSCPNDKNENTEANLATAFVDYRELISVSDNSGEVLHIYPDPYEVYPADVGIGKNVFTFTATDLSNNTGNCTFTVTVKDNQNPVVSCPNNMSVNTESDLAIAFVDYIELISVSDNSGEDLHIYPDRYEVYPADVGIGKNVFTFTATDSSNNTGNCTFTVTVKDNQNPVVLCPNDTYENTEAHLAIAYVDYRELISVSDNSGEDLHIYPDPYEVYPADVGIGKNVFTFTATDSSNNTGNCTFTVTVKDNQNPVVSCPNDMNEITEENLATAFVDYRELISVSDNSGEDLYIYPDPNETYPADVGIGKHSFVFTATDSTDNTGNCTFTVMVEDNQKPVVSCPNNMNENTEAHLATAFVDYRELISVSDNSGEVLHIYPDPYEVYPADVGIGKNVFTFTATDLSNNTGNCTFTVTVKDNQNPVVSCPNNMSVNTESDLAIAFVDYIELISVSDNSGEDLHIYPDRYEVYPADVGIGKNVFTFTATDSSNNTGNCTFTVTVKDNQNPVVLCPNDTYENTEAHLAIAYVDYRELISVSDNSGEDLHIYPDPYEVYPADVGIGKNVFTFTATDSSNNTGNCTFTVTVKG
ncbi:hyalin-like [Antedon mediterranea]|uniref:hyalin-like n=1 Tax=Antedon mediterranea TaxID=105859 RepID=UPI003AF58D95